MGAPNQGGYGAPPPRPASQPRGPQAPRAAGRTPRQTPDYALPASNGAAQHYGRGSVKVARGLRRYQRSQNSAVFVRRTGFMRRLVVTNLHDTVIDEHRASIFGARRYARAQARRAAGMKDTRHAIRVLGKRAWTRDPRRLGKWLLAGGLGVAGGYLAYKYSIDVANSLGDYFGQLTDSTVHSATETVSSAAGSTVTNGVNSLASGAGESLADLAPTVQESVNNAVTTIGQNLQDAAGQGVTDLGQTASDNITQALNDLVTRFGDNPDMEAIGNIQAQLSDVIADASGNLRPGVENALADAFANVRPGNALADSLREMAPRIDTALSGVATSAGEHTEEAVRANLQKSTTGWGDQVAAWLPGHVFQPTAAAIGGLGGAIFGYRVGRAHAINKVRPTHVAPSMNAVPRDAVAHFAELALREGPANGKEVRLYIPATTGVRQ